MEKDIYVSISAMFDEFSGLPNSDLCLKLKKSLYGLKEAPKLWHDWLAKALVCAGFTSSSHDPENFFGKGMSLAVYVDDVLFFGHDVDETEKVFNKLQLDDFELKVEKKVTQNSFDFLGIHIVKDNTNSNSPNMVQ